MKKFRFYRLLLNKTLNKRSIGNTILSLLICLSINSGVNGQMACEGHLNVSLNSSCNYQVLPNRMLTGTLPDCTLPEADRFTVMLTDHYDQPIVDDILNATHLGQTVTVKVMNNCTTNSCWGTILVEDKIAPTIVCDTVAVLCLDMDTYLPQVLDNCQDSDNVEMVQVGGTTTLADCDNTNNYIKTIQRTYVAEDQSGMRSDPCVQMINIVGIDPANILGPPNLAADTALDCNGDYEVDGNGHPHPNVAGIPQLVIPDLAIAEDTLPLWPAIGNLCKAVATYEDTPLPGKNGCGEKIARTWSLYDACSTSDPATFWTYTQMIYIDDKEAPVISCSDSLTLVGTPIASANSCLLSVNIPSATATDNCSTVQYIGVDIDNVPTLATNGGTISIAPGMYALKYKATDGCNAAVDCITEIEIIDNSRPIAICDKNTVIGLTSDGTVEVDAAVFDDGSFDACGLGQMQIARVGTQPCAKDNSEFGPTITFCCEDADQTISAIFRVFDLSGSFSDCEVNIAIQDKTAPNASCPSAREILCDAPIDINDLSDFGSATSNNECGTGVKELDPQVELNSCNKGRVIRRWVASNSETDTVCEQIITIDNPIDFDIANIGQFIVEPNGVEMIGCGALIEPDNLPEGSQRPEILSSNSCDLIGTSYKDEVYNVAGTGQGCLKIVRAWTILNWCAPEDKNSIQIAQIIKITDVQGPIITPNPNNQKVYCNEITNCDDGLVTLSASAVDSCTNNLLGSVLLDLDNDGVIDETFSRTPDLVSGVNTIDFSYTYPLGEHRVQFVFTDACGLTAVHDHIFTLQNCKAPTCVLNNLNINLRSMDQGPMECIWAEDFDASSSSNCTGGGLSYFFDAAFTLAETCFMCDAISTQSIDIYVVDEFGNSVLCRPMLTVTDHDDLCASQNLEGQNSTESISGLIENHKGGMIEEAMVTLTNTEYPGDMTREDGAYAFSAIPTHRNYSINVEKDGDFINGVSTLDLVMIQKHILGLKLINNPYDLIAADINKSGKISGQDLVELRKLILGDIDQFSSNTSWRFVDKAYEFNNPANPLSENFPEEYEIVDLSERMKVDFIGLKVGDVSGNAKSNGFSKSEVRSNDTALRVFADKAMNAEGNVTVIEITSDNFKGVTGFQTTLEFQEGAVEFLGVENGSIEMTESNIGSKYADRGLLSLSWSSPASMSIEEDKVLFKLLFKELGEKAVEIKLSSALTNTEVYFGESVSDVINLSSSNEITLVVNQNIPNPWSTKTEIQFESSSKGEVMVSVYDLFGKTILVKSITSKKGLNSIHLDRKDITSSGIYLYEINNGNQKVINKMIVID